MTYSFTTPDDKNTAEPTSRVRVVEPTTVNRRDKGQRPRGGYTPSLTNSIDAEIITLTKQKDSLELRKRALQDSLKKAIEQNLTQLAAQLRSELAGVSTELSFVYRSLAIKTAQRKEVAAETAKAAPSPNVPGDTQVTPTKKTPPQDTTAAINLSACKELYFRGEQRFLMETLDIPANAPGFVPSLSPIANYQNAETLWKNGIATKGRIQTFVPFTASSSSSSLGGRQLEEFASSKAAGRKAFQFHYNPGSVDMTYGSVNDVDLGYLASGQAVTNFLQALGNVSFEILLNRMPDMKYIDPNSSNFRKNGVNYPRDVYDRSPRTDSKQSNELREIYNKGTMYDLEFLLRILMGGVSFTSQLRGGEITSDLGFAIPQPVELHLGSRLRYVISVTSLVVRHVIFNERMVPLFSTISITANRVPADTVSATSLDLSGGQAALSTPSNPTIR